jgi:acyl-CoA dehydrogenase
VSDPLDPLPDAPPFEPRHAAVRTQVRAWVDDRIVPYVDEWESARDFPRALVAEAGALGLLGYKYPPEDGGSGPDPLADVVVTEELARCGSGGVAAGLGATKDLAPYYVARFGSRDQRRQWLTPAARGDAVAGLAVTEPGAGSDVAALVTRAARHGDGWRLDGTKTFCTNGSRADWVLVAARTAEQPGPRAISLFIVPTSAEGFSASRIATLGWRTSQTGALILSGVVLPEDALLGGVGEGFAMIMRSFEWERLQLALAGCSGAAADLAEVRSLGFGGDRFADLATRLSGVRALAYDALAGHLAGREAAPAVAAAKWLAADLAVATADLRVAVAGPRGGDALRAAERALRDARLGPIGGGAREVMAELVARSLGLA